ncbi:MAG: HIT family hydrolase [Candidatus Nephthysia bennettiae]|uniref:HIT domain-containing protein n=1 Tax=Candidatus Nephthysia bennettiae TaxID=3127016 RepID=A0A934K0W0_9BACT|nr:HIT domain-containing protein [Candidatus Dormibacteraeota bacterium]PZR86344.1 MAG: HIT family hydrolase [Candidatus Dormibacteraeota bacterium]
MRNLFAPWRMAYIGAPQQPGCLFCRTFEASPEDDRGNLVVLREAEALAMMNRFPYNNGHIMVAPRAHEGSLTGLDDEQLLAIMRLTQRSIRVLEDVMSPEAFNVGVNIGRVAGAGIPDHVHIHVVPRWNGDTNFMPVLGEVKVINEHLEATWDKLAAAFASSSSGPAQRP